MCVCVCVTVQFKQYQEAVQRGIAEERDMVFARSSMMETQDDTTDVRQIMRTLETDAREVRFHFLPVSLTSTSTLH